MRSNGPPSLNRLGLQRIGYRTFAEVVGRLCAFALIVLAARTLPTSEFGVFSLAWTSGWLISILGDLGLQIHLARQVALHPDSAASIFRRLLAPRLFLVGVLLVVSTAAVWWLSPPHSRLAVLGIVTSHLAINLLDFTNHLFRGLELSHWEASLNLLLRASGVGLATALALLWGSSLIFFAVALQASAWISLSVAGWLALKWILIGSRDEPVDGKRRPTLASQWPEIWPIGLGILLSALYFRLDLFVLDAFRGSHEVGLYNAVFRLVDASRLFPAAVLAVVFPWLCRPGKELVFRQTVIGLGVLSTLLAGGGWWLADHIVAGFYGPRFLEASPTFRLLLLSLPLFFLNFALTHRLIADGLQRAYAWICGGGLVSSLLLTLLLVPSYSLEGAAWACWLREGLISCACCWMLWREGGARKRSSLEESEADPDPSIGGIGA